MICCSKGDKWRVICDENSGEIVISERTGEHTIMNSKETTVLEDRIPPATVVWTRSSGCTKKAYSAVCGGGRRVQRRRMEQPGLTLR